MTRTRKGAPFRPSRAFKEALAGLGVYLGALKPLIELVGLPAAAAVGAALLAGAWLRHLWLRRRVRRQPAPAAGAQPREPRRRCWTLAGLAAAAVLIALWGAAYATSGDRPLVERLGLDRGALLPAADAQPAEPRTGCGRTAGGGLHLRLEPDPNDPRRDDWAVSCCLALPREVRLPAASRLRVRVRLAQADEIELKVEGRSAGVPHQIGWLMKGSLGAGDAVLELPLRRMPTGRPLDVEMRAGRICAAFVDAGPGTNELWLEAAERR